ncbi:MAG: DsbA family oxidoreductase [Actinobacteria bacterium]|nr:DsbA family oxidoreductase [Actinomycetota bacterium]
MLVEIWVDVVCPWCAVGHARFRRALEDFAHAGDVEVVYRSYELDPNAPARRRGSMTDHLAAKYGLSVDEARRMNDHMVEVAALDGLTFDFDRARAGNTFDAHRLLQLALVRGCQHELLDSFLRGYFAEGMPVADHDALVERAVAVGLDAAEVASVLGGDTYGAEVRADELRAHQLGVTGVPFFLVDGRFAIPGAQPIERFVQALDRAWAKITASPVP